MYQYTAKGNRVGENSYTIFMFFDGLPSQYTRYYLPMQKDIDNSIVTGIEFRYSFPSPLNSPDLNGTIQYNGKNYIICYPTHLMKMTLTIVNKKRRQTISNTPAMSLVKNRSTNPPVPFDGNRNHIIFSKKMFLEILSGESYIIFTDVAALPPDFCVGITFHFDDKK